MNPIALQTILVYKTSSDTCQLPTVRKVAHHGSNRVPSKRLAIRAFVLSPDSTVSAAMESGYYSSAHKRNSSHQSAELFLLLFTTCPRSIVPVYYSHTSAPAYGGFPQRRLLTCTGRVTKNGANEILEIFSRVESQSRRKVFERAALIRSPFHFYTSLYCRHENRCECNRLSCGNVAIVVQESAI